MLEGEVEERYGGERWRRGGGARSKGRGTEGIGGEGKGGQERDNNSHLFQLCDRRAISCSILSHRSRSMSYISSPSYFNLLFINYLVHIK